MCQICAEICHEGHEVVKMQSNSSMYCDCGESFEGCSFKEEVKEKIEEKIILGKSKN